jgi:S-adenosylmethionine:tRNA ribosyltransferase-isomerase
MSIPFTLDDFDFDLPQARIAQTPMRPRDAARLLEIGSTLEDLSVADLPARLEPGDLLVVNDTKVIPARLHGTRGQARVQATLNQHVDANRWKVFAKPGRRLRVGETIIFGTDFEAEIIEKLPDGQIILEFHTDDFAAALLNHGAMPLPPYIERLPSPTESDFQDYQTVYAANDGAIAAPTAGLHFTDALFKGLQSRDIEQAMVTLHVGAGTFLPVRVDSPADHSMHAEVGEITEETAARINETRANGGRIVAVGTTSLRLLESAVDDKGVVHPFSRETDIFILPGFEFKAADLLMTNFHLPRSTLFMLVAAFAGLTRMQAAYAHAIEQEYRFYSYGDACLLHKAKA